jgi:arginyl-tRNA synthetase
MEDTKAIIQKILQDALKLESISLEVPPKLELGDYAFPCFILSKQLKKSPMDVAKDIEQQIKPKLPTHITSKIIGPYVNFFVSKEHLADSVLKKIHAEKEKYGKEKESKEIVLIESPGPNTNKPLHLGHLRNILLGQSICNILRAAGKKTHIVNVVNDRGVHICKSMFAYQKFGNGTTPEKAGMKSDHFVGDFYVKYAKAEKESPELEDEIQKLLVKWEQGDKETRELWKKMNDWALKGFNETYKKLKFKIEKEYLESETYMHGKEIILDGLKKGLFEKDGDENIILNLEAKGLGKKVLLRSNGTSVYITQDIYMAKKRYDDFKFDSMVYVVGNEQEYHFKVLFEVFKKLGWSFGEKCYHFSYGMVELPEGKMKSREGNVVDTDELIDEVVKIAKEEIIKRYDSLDEKEIEKRANAIAMAAIRFFFLKHDPLKNFIFNPKESLAFEGETGPYVMYSYARICSIFEKLDEKVDLSIIDSKLLNTELDRKMLNKMKEYPDVIKDAAKQYRPSLIAYYLLDLASAFNEYYRDNTILKADKPLRNARLALIDSVRIVIKSGLELLEIDVLEQM